MWTGRAPPTYPQPRLLRRTGSGHGEVDTADFPFVADFHQDSADETETGGFVWEDTHDLSAALDLAVEAFNGV